MFLEISSTDLILTVLISVDENSKAIRTKANIKTKSLNRLNTRALKADLSVSCLEFQ